MLLYLLLLMPLATAPAQVSPEPVRQRVERGYKLAQAGDLKAAETELSEAVRLAPNNAIALAVLGMVLSQQPSRLEEANTCLQRALKLDPADSGTRYNLAFNQFRLGKLEDSKANLERILKEKPDHRQAASLLDAIRAKSGYAAALDQYRAAHYAESQKLLDQLIAGGSPDTKALTLLAWCHQRQNRPNEALATMRRAIELTPSDAALYSNAAQILLEDRDFKAAYATVTKALDLAPDNVQALKIKGLVDLERGDPKQALTLFQRAVELDPSDPEALQRLGTTQQALFRYSDAAGTFEKGIARFPAWAPLYEGYGKLLLDPGSKSGATAVSRGIALLEKALALDPSLPEAHYQLGKRLMDDGRESEALPHLEAAAKLDPWNSAIHLALAGAYRLLGRSQDQARELRLYRELEASNAR